MNLWAVVAGVLALVAFGVHAVVGGREFRLFEPAPRPTRTAWVQALAGWHWVAVTLLAAAVLFLLIGVSEVVPAEAAVLRALGGYFALCGAAWGVTVALVGGGIPRRFLVLGQWLFCFLIAALAFLAA